MSEDGRPFYHRFAWAYDLLVDDPAAPWIRAVEALSGGIRATVLDASCGTGQHAVALAARGHTVTGVDAAEELLQVARARARRANVALRLECADLRTLDLGSVFDVIACRGVLDDMLEDGDRDAVLEAFARHLVAGGALVLDVRDREATALRYANHPGEHRSVPIAGGELLLTRRGRFDRRTGHLLIDETHRLRRGDSEEVAQHRFVMRCWTPDELRRRLGSTGFEQITIRSAIRSGYADRLVATARRRP